MNDIVSSVLESSRREARFVAVVWLTACLYIVVYAALFAYRQDQPPTFILGMPSWVFWGVAAPWVTCTVTTCIYALWCIRDEDLGEEQSGHTASVEAAQSQGAGNE